MNVLSKMEENSHLKRNIDRKTQHNVRCNGFNKFADSRDYDNDSSYFGKKYKSNKRTFNCKQKFNNALNCPTPNPPPPKK